MNILNGDTRTVTCDPMNDADVWYIMRQVNRENKFTGSHFSLNRTGDLELSQLVAADCEDSFHNYPMCCSTV